MAKDKKSFIAYCDWVETFDELTDEEAGKLAKHLFRYVNDQDPEAPDRLTKMLFIDLRRALKRDLKKYEGYIEKQRENGAKGGRPKKTQITQPFIEKPKKPVTVNVTVNDIVNDILLEKETKDLFAQWIDFRKEIKKPVKADSTKITLAKKIKAEGFQRSKVVIQHSIDNEYQGLFWDRQQQSKTDTVVLDGRLPDSAYE